MIALKFVVNDVMITLSLPQIAVWADGFTIDFSTRIDYSNTSESLLFTRALNLQFLGFTFSIIKLRLASADDRAGS